MGGIVTWGSSSGGWSESSVITVSELLTFFGLPGPLFLALEDSANSDLDIFESAVVHRSASEILLEFSFETVLRPEVELGLGPIAVAVAAADVGVNKFFFLPKMGKIMAFLVVGGGGIGFEIPFSKLSLPASSISMESMESME
jgi:hypothetical protein